MKLPEKLEDVYLERVLVDKINQLIDYLAEKEEKTVNYLTDGQMYFKERDVSETYFQGWKDGQQALKEMFLERYRGLIDNKYD